MKLADLLADLSTEELERIGHEHAHADDQMSRPILIDTIESVLRSYRFLQEFLVDRQPPTFAIVVLLLDAPGFALSTGGFREAVLAETDRVSAAIDAGAILKREDQLRVYRKVLYRARSNDLKIDTSEAALLDVLRQELDVATVEHFLIEHHADLREFWHEDHAFARELLALRSAGLVFVRDGNTMLPHDIAPMIRQVLGIEMSRDAARRLFDLLGGTDLHDALDAIGAPTSGSKDERIDRLLAHMVTPSSVLARTSLETLRYVCRKVNLPSATGNKADLVQRIVAWVAAGRDLVTEADEPPPPEPEPRRLTESRFRALFEELPGHQLAGVLGEFDLRRWGTKTQQLDALWGCDRSEHTLLRCLTLPDLDWLLDRHGLRRGGSKPERIHRLVEHFANGDAQGPPS